jgi:hypothetical protein
VAGPEQQPGSPGVGGAAAEAGRFAEKDLASILRHQRRNTGDGVVVPLIEGPSLQTVMSRWAEVGR